MTARKSKRARALPLLFTQPNVLKVMDGSKTQTRRTRGLDFPAAVGGPDRGQLLSVKVVGDRTVATFGDSIPDDPVPLEIRCPYGAPGGELWVRETWGYRGGLHSSKLPKGMRQVDIDFAADGKRLKFLRPEHDESGIPKQHLPEKFAGLSADGFRDGGEFDAEGLNERAEWYRRWWASWRPSIFLPRWAARTFLLVKSIRVERLHAISSRDCIAEGIAAAGRMPTGRQQFFAPGLTEPFYSPHEAFRALWESVNGAGSWALNPWLWVIDFRKAKP